MDFVLTEDEQRFTEEMVALCSPRNAEKNPTVAAVMAILRPEIAEGFEALCRRKQELVAGVGIAVTKLLAVENVDRGEASRTLVEFLSALGDVTLDQTWPAIESIGGGGDNFVLEDIYNLDSPLARVIRQAVMEGVPATDVLVTT